MISPITYMRAARVPDSIKPATFFPWEIIKRPMPHGIGFDGFETQTMLTRWGWSSLHQEHGEIVMDDSLVELRRHLPIWMKAKGRVLKTGLGLGCVVRGLLINPAVEHIDVVEIDEHIIKHCGGDFIGNPRVTIHLADATTWDFGDRRWDYAWHDVHDNFETQHLTVTHAHLIERFIDRVPLRNMGAWAFPREIKRRLGGRMLG